MARTNRGGSGVFIAGPANEAEEAEFLGGGPGGGLDNDQESAFEEFRSQATQSQEGLTTWVYRVPTDEKGDAQPRAKLEQLFTSPVDLLSTDQIFGRVREYMDENDKTWLVRIMVRQNAGGVVRLNQLFSVRNLPPGQRNGKSAAQSSQFGEVMAGVEKLVNAQQTRTDELLSRLSMRQTAQPDTFSMRDMLQMQESSTQRTIAMMTAMMGAMGGRNSDAGDPVEKVVKMMTSLNALRGEMGGGGDSDTGMAGIVRAVAPMGVEFLKVLQRNGQGQGQPQISGPPRVASVPTVQPYVPPGAAPPPSQLVQPTDDAMIAQLREQLSTLADIAAEKPDPKIIAQQTLEMLPEEFDDRIYSILSGDNWFAILSAMQPKIKPHQEWMTAVRNEIVASFSESSPPTV